MATDNEKDNLDQWNEMFLDNPAKAMQHWTQQNNKVLRTEYDRLQKQDNFWQPQCRIDQRRDVDSRAIGLLMQAGIHRFVGLFQAADADRRTAPQKRVIGADVEFDLFVMDHRHGANHELACFLLLVLRGTLRPKYITTVG